MAKKIFSIFFIAMIVTSTPQLLHAEQTTFTNEQAKTLFENSVTILNHVDELGRVADDLQKVIETLTSSISKESNESTDELWTYMLVGAKIRQVHLLLSYEIEAQALYLAAGDTMRKSESGIFFRSNNSKVLRDTAQRTLEGIQDFYGYTNNNGVLRLYDKAKDILRALLPALNENFDVYSSIKPDTD